MARVFNVTGFCDPNLHYMVDIQENLKQIKDLIDAGAYFTINRARQYGKTTTLKALKKYIKEDYVVVSIDFQFLSSSCFRSEGAFVKAFSRELLSSVDAEVFSDGIEKKLENLAKMSGEETNLQELFFVLSMWCRKAEKPIVLMIDEVDSATNNEVFLDFLSQLRGYYMHRDEKATFQSVILAGVYDVKNIRRKIRAEEEHKVNSPWNIAAEFPVNMSFSKDAIADMLREYDKDHQTGMDADGIAGLIFDATAGYPFLVSRLCKLIDEKVAGTERFPDLCSAWTKEGYMEAEKMLTHEKNTLFDSLTGKLIDYPDLKKLICVILFEGKTISYVSGNPCIEMAAMLGFVRNEHHTVVISNRIFEMVLYDQLLSEEEVSSSVYALALSDKNRFIQDGRLDMKLVLERFVIAFTELYQDKDDVFKEEMGRKYFMLFLKPIINGTGHSYVEARTRNMKRTDIIVDYRGEQFIVELKIWRGQKYHAEGERQIAEYLDYYELKKGYMLIFNFNRNKKIGVVEKKYKDRILVEATV